VEKLLAAMEQIVDDLYGHVHRVGAIASQIGVAMDLDRTDLERLALVGVFHDVGKIHVDPTIIAKPGPLVGEEITAMRRHPEYGYAMTVAGFDPAIAEAILYHHERWDGAGYPHGLAATEIPLLSRVVLVADAFDAITSRRAYQPAMPFEYAIDELTRNAGSQFDPRVVAAFLDVVDQGSLETIPLVSVPPLVAG
jgi:HD-GYP domain-containing protein (c-di-GMP phosphodiesterase class II)